MGLIGDLDKRLCMVIHSLYPFTMAPRTSKSKNPAKATLVNAASASAASSPSAINEFAGKYFNLYNDLLAAKNKLLTADPGGEQMQALAEFGAGLVCLPHFELHCFFILIHFQGKLGPCLDRMTELTPTNWNIQGIESMADWANELAIISSSIIAKHQCTLLEYDARLTMLTQPYSSPLPTTTPSCRLSRF